MKRYNIKQDEFVGVYNLIDVVNHNTESFERSIKAVNRKVRRRSLLGGVIVVGLGYKIYDLYKELEKAKDKIKELEEKGD